MTFKCWTDGAQSGSTKRGGWAYLIVDEDNKLLELDGNAAEGMMVTNNRMELVAAIEALRKVKSIRTEGKVIVYTDSRYVMGPFVEGHSINANQDLFSVLTPLVEELDVTFRWVRGHSRHRFNNFVDSLARLYAGTF